MRRSRWTSWSKGGFLNCAVEGETEVAALELLQALRGIELRMGSKKLVPKGPRRIDMDILLYGSETIDTPALQVPHPRMDLRRVGGGRPAASCPGGGLPSRGRC